MKKLFFTTFILAVVVSFFSTPVLAYVMQSTNYRLQFDSINNGGGLASSTDYKVEDTVGEIASGGSSSTTYKLQAGYQQMYQSNSTSTVISLTVPDSVALAPNISGLTGGTATGSAYIIVSTNNNQGYTLQVSASTTPSLKSSSDSFADYPEVAPGTPDFDWSVAPTSSVFGFSVEGDNVYQKFLDDGAVCNAGSGNIATKCWSPFSTTPDIFGYSASANPDGSTTTLQFRAEAGAQKMQSAGSYSANLTITAYVN